jgi:hypothetical protein
MEGPFPYPVVFIAVVWFILGLAYLIARCRQRPKATYIIPRVFVLCSPRTVQFHYEMILRIGMPSADYNPEKHDIDITVQGQQRNEVVPMTRLNTKTLLDEPLITSLSMIVYRLVEMPPLGSLVLRHSGPFRSWVYVYDFTVIDLSTNKEQYYTINKYVGSLNRTYPLEEHQESAGVHYPIDDVPLPPWSIEDIFLVIFMVVNCIMLSLMVLPLSCDNRFLSDLISITLVALQGGAIVFFLEWLLYYYARWNSDRREYFNLNNSGFINIETIIRILAGVFSTVAGAMAIYFGLKINEWHESLVWMLATTNTCILVIGFWNVTRLIDLSETIASLGLKIKGVDSVYIGMKYSEIVSDIQTKSGSASDAGSSVSSTASKFVRSFGPRSSVKSFGFDPITGHPSRQILNKAAPGRQGSKSGSSHEHSQSKKLKS